MNTILGFATSLSNISGSLFCMILSLVLLGLSVFTGPVNTEGPFYRRYDLFRAGVFFFVLSVALGGK